MSISPSEAVPINQADHELRQVLLRLNEYAMGQAQLPTVHSTKMLTHLVDLMLLFMAVGQYEQAALANVPAPSADVSSLTPAQLHAYRKANPIIYRLGWDEGRQAGIAQAEQERDRLLSLYAQYATLPKKSFDCSPLMKRVQLLLGFRKDSTPLSNGRLNTLRQQIADCSGDTALHGTH